MTTNNNNDFAELRHALEAATKGEWQGGLHALHDRPYEGMEYVELEMGDTTLVGYSRVVNVRFAAIAHNHLPDLFAALDQARAERDALRQRLMEAKENLETSNVELHAALYCLELNGIATDEVCERLAARDARMKRDGVITGIEQARDMMSMAESSEEADELMRTAANKLRKGGE